LELVTDKDGVFVQPGMAIDGYGRELILPERQSLPLNEFEAKESDILEVWLIYNRSGSDQSPPGYNSCAPEKMYYRWQEVSLVRLEKPDLNYPDPRYPKGVPEGDQAFKPSSTPPDDPERQWPVFLGRVLRARNKPDQPPVYSVTLSNRPYVGLVGESVAAPSGNAIIAIENKPSDSDSSIKTHRFSIFMRNNNNLQEPFEPFRIEDDGKLSIKGEMHLQGSLKMAGGTVEFQADTATSDINTLPPCSSPLPAVTPDSLQPWRIYYYHCSREQADPADPAGQTVKIIPIQQLRVEMIPAAVAQQESEVVIGAWSPDDKVFKPLLTINNHRGVIVDGNLMVTGKIKEEQAAVTPKLSQQVKDFLVSS
jgi:hypothetical protein